jgi:DNA-binding response OmpR family regulator
MTKILYVEDEPFLAKIVQETLSSNGYNITLIIDGGKAVEAFNNGSFDICILDIMLPNKNGFDIALEIREINDEIPILFLTAKDQTQDLVRGFKVGGNDYIRKPFSMEELMVRIENMLSLTSAKKSSQNAQDEIEIGQSFRYYPLKLSLQYGQESRNLSHRECEILTLLCKHQNEAISRKKILKQIWGDDSFYNSRNLDVYITKLRGYFKLDPGIKIITLKGVGYQFTIG